jgi:flagellar biosynthesis anti-sigma factor FlgM
MKIELNPQTASQLAPERVGARASNTGPAATQGASEDRTTFHSDGAAVRALTTQALKSPEIRQETVDTLRKSVNSGEYKIDTARIAGAISSHS